MANFGLDDLRVVNPYEVAFREAVSAVGGAHVLEHARVFAGIAESVSDCSLVVGTTAGQHRELQQPVERLETGMQTIREHAGRAAILFGSEKFGLSNDDLSYCHSLIRIPTDPRTPSMNLGQAVAVCLYELSRAVPRRTTDPSACAPGNPKPPRSVEAAEGADAEQLSKMLLDVLARSGYTNRITATSTERKIRRFVRRMRLTRRDVPLLLGILRQVLWKIEERK